MIHELLILTRPLFVLDTETTGLNVQTDHIVELGFQRWEAAGMTKEWRSLINPTVPIPEIVTKVHGIDDGIFKTCRRCGGLLDNHAIGKVEESIDPLCIDPTPYPRFKDLATNLAFGLSNCDFAGKNVRFDLRILDAEFRRAGVPWSYVGARIIDIDRLEALAHPRDLEHLHEKYVGMKHDGAHGALSDVRASATVIVKQLEAHGDLFSHNLDTLHQQQWPGWLVADGSFRLVNGVATCTFGKHRDKAMRDIPRDYWDWMLTANFPEDVMQLARDAKMGKFPMCTPEEARAADGRQDQ